MTENASCFSTESWLHSAPQEDEKLASYSLENVMSCIEISGSFLESLEGLCGEKHHKPTLLSWRGSAAKDFQNEQNACEIFRMDILSVLKSRTDALDILEFLQSAGTRNLDYS